jgi:RNA polymerase sigma factor (sigma-70 family)
MNPIQSHRLESEDSDRALVARCLAGEHDAFARLVARHQSLVCSVTYSTTGRIALSEELAQETFLIAWRQLSELREPERLRAWLVGIARNLAQEAMRRHARDVASLPLDAANELAAPGPCVQEHAERDQQERMVWHALDRIPSRYREPLVLFYREQQSVERVAQALEISVENAKQRLSRGRKMLHDEVASMVEGTLERSGPGSAFTIAIIGALPGITASSGAQAAALSAGVSTASGVLGTLAKFSGALVGAIGALLGAHIELALARDARERGLVVRETARVLLATALFVLALWGLLLSAPSGARGAAWWIGMGAALASVYAIWFARTVVHGLRARRALVVATDARDEYRSRSGLLGLPWVHVRWRTPSAEAKPVRAWIAIGDRAIGGLFALGTIAIAPIALGAVSFGVIAVGGVALGGLAVAGAAFGIYALGGTAIGVLAVGGYALGGVAAAGHLAAATHYAIGISAHASEVNNAAAAAYLFGPWPARLWLAACTTLALSFVPTLIYLRRLRRRAT